MCTLHIRSEVLYQEFAIEGTDCLAYGHAYGEGGWLISCDDISIFTAIKKNFNDQNSRFDAVLANMPHSPCPMSLSTWARPPIVTSLRFRREGDGAGVLRASARLTVRSRTRSQAPTCPPPASTPHQCRSASNFSTPITPPRGSICTWEHTHQLGKPHCALMEELSDMDASRAGNLGEHRAQFDARGNQRSCVGATLSGVSVPRSLSRSQRKRA